MMEEKRKQPCWLTRLLGALDGSSKESDLDQARIMMQAAVIMGTIGAINIIIALCKIAKALVQ